MQIDYNDILSKPHVQRDFIANIDKLIKHAKKYGYAEEAVRLARGRKMVLEDIASLA
jgi:hypothetical protein